MLAAACALNLCVFVTGQCIAVDLYLVLEYFTLFVSRFDLGKGPALIRSKEKVTLNEWHDVTAARVGSRGELKVDNQQPVIGRPAFTGLTQLNVDTNLYLGFIPQPSKGYAHRFISSAFLLHYTIVTLKFQRLSKPHLSPS